MPTAADYSTQIDTLDANPQAQLDAGQWDGRVRSYAFDWTGDIAQNEYVEVVRLPQGARILSGRVDFTDFGSTTTMDIGDGTTDDKYGAAIDVSGAAGNADFANTWALYGLGRERLSAATSLWLKMEAANPASGSVRGYVLVAI